MLEASGIVGVLVKRNSNNTVTVAVLDVTTCVPEEVTVKTSNVLAVSHLALFPVEYGAASLHSMLALMADALTILRARRCCCALHCSV